MDELKLSHLLVSQYRASLAMLKQAIEICPEDLWLSAEYRNKSWHIAYHAVFYTYFYVQAGEKDLPTWAKHQPDLQYLGPRPWAPNDAPAVVKPYSRADVLEYHKLCCTEVEARVPKLDLSAASGFYWLPFNKMELQLYNIRHLQHHTGQLADRLRTVADVGVDWVRAG
ncbi:MAG: DinB family protein [Terriglobales bacterium]|jgi:hypothetical protein